METELMETMTWFIGKFKKFWEEGREEENCRPSEAVQRLRDVVDLPDLKEKNLDIENLATLQDELKSIEHSYPTLRDKFRAVVELLNTGIKKEKEDAKERVEAAKRREKLCKDVLDQMKSSGPPDKKLEKICDLINDNKLTDMMDERGWNTIQRVGLVNPAKAEQPEDEASALENALSDRLEFLDSCSGQNNQKENRKITDALRKLAKLYYGIK